MIWWRRRRPSPETAAARDRLEEARQDLAAAREDDGKVNEVAERLERLSSRNHFGPMITEALRGSRG